MVQYVVKKSEIEAMDGIFKIHSFNPNAQRTGKSLGDLAGLTGLGFHMVEIAPNHESTEYHMHYHEDECYNYFKASMYF